MRIPCYLTNRDCLAPVRGMVERLQHCDDVGEIVIVDCDSTYPPLLDWYEHCGVTIKRCPNLGPQATWKSRQHVSKFYFVSDADLDISAVPLDFLCRLQDGLQEHPNVIKAGLSLQIDDFSPDLPLTAKALRIETPYWANRIDQNWYDAPIDTTAAMYRNPQWGGYGPALRAAPPYTARHLAWYLRPGQIPEDWQYYLDHLNPQGIVWSPTLKSCLS